LRRVESCDYDCGVSGLVRMKMRLKKSIRCQMELRDGFDVVNTNSLIVEWQVVLFAGLMQRLWGAYRLWETFWIVYIYMIRDLSFGSVCCDGGCQIERLRTLLIALKEF
jgi:hypothetical protein